jgi:hypothetical protein
MEYFRQCFSYGGTPTITPFRTASESGEFPYTVTEYEKIKDMHLKLLRRKMAGEEMTTEETAWMDAFCALEEEWEFDGYRTHVSTVQKEVEKRTLSASLGTEGYELVAVAATEAARMRSEDPCEWEQDAWTNCDGEGLEQLLLADKELGNISPVRLLDARFLIEVARRGGRLHRRQDLPAEAFLECPEKMIFGPFHSLRVLCVSYPWLQPDHPDPKGSTLQLLCRVLEQFVAYEDSSYPYRTSATFGVFIDFCSLPQKDAEGKRTPNELALFQRALGCLDQLYSHPFTWIIKATALPKDYPAGFSFPEFFPDGTKCTPNKASYYDRGWCFCESSMGNLVKSSRLTLDLARFSGTKQDLESIVRECAAGRAPPLHPDAFAQQLDAKSFTSKKADIAMVAGLYRRAFEKRIGNAQLLDFTNLDWGDEEAKVLAAALGAAASCVKLNLADNRIGDKGAVALAASLRKGAAPQLDGIYLDDNRIGDEGAAAFATWLREGPAPMLHRIELCNNQIGNNGVAAFTASMRECAAPHLEALAICFSDSDSNPVSQAAVRALEDALRHEPEASCRKAAREVLLHERGYHLPIGLT